VLPILLVNLGVSSALVANLAVFSRYQDGLMIAGAVLLAGAILLALRGARPPRARFWVSVGATIVLLAGAWILPAFEGELLAWIRRG